MVTAGYEDFLPYPWPAHPDTALQGWADGHQHVLDSLDKELLTVIASHQVDHANGIDLNQIGAIFGDLGKRRGRSDSRYRRYLKSLVESYTGNGTTGAIRFAIASGIVKPQAAVDVQQDYEELEYDVTLTDWTNHEIGTVWHLADLADPSCVNMRSLTYEHGNAGVVVAPSESTEVTTVHEQGDAVVEINASESTADMDRDRGLGSGEYDGTGELGG